MPSQPFKMPTSRRAVATRSQWGDAKVSEVFAVCEVEVVASGCWWAKLKPVVPSARRALLVGGFRGLTAQSAKQNRADTGRQQCLTGMLGRQGQAWRRKRQPQSVLQWRREWVCSKWANVFLSFRPVFSTAASHAPHHQTHHFLPQFLN